jgi:hypothetical protein
MRMPTLWGLRREIEVSYDRVLSSKVWHIFGRDHKKLDLVAWLDSVAAAPYPPVRMSRMEMDNPKP